MIIFHVILMFKSEEKVRFYRTNTKNLYAVREVTDTPIGLRELMFKTWL